jgi:enamine deaminase RidA (YjgF/YER057c/UK114 family)
VKVTGFVSSTNSFFEQPAVMNGASDFLVEVFGDAGKHVRSAVGVSALPKDATVEVELIVEIES